MRLLIPDNVTKTGCLIGAVFISRERPEITVTAESNGVVRTSRRIFNVVE